MIGPDPKYSGGIETVIRNFRYMSSESLRFSNISTWRPDSRHGVKLVMPSILKLLSYFRVRQETLIHVHFGHGGSFVRESIYSWISKFCGFKVFATFHGNNFSELNTYRWKFFLKAVVFPPIIQIVVLSPSAQDLVQRCGREALLRPNPISTHRNLVSKSIRENYVFFAGRLERRKGIDLLTKAWNTISPRYPDLVLKLAGPPGDIQISEVQKLPNSQYLGVLDSEEIALLCAKSLAVILPSRKEQSPLVLWEAMSSGSLIISTNVGGIPWMVGSDYPFLMSDFTEEALIEVFESFMSNIHKYDVIGKELHRQSLQAVPKGFLQQYKEDINFSVPLEEL